MGKEKNSKQFAYNQFMDVKFAHHQLIDIPALVASCDKAWYNQTLSQVNSSVVRLGIVEGDYHWHKHEEEDEFFFVLSGKLLIDLEDRTIELNPQQGTTISRGVMHRPRALQKTVMLMVESATIDPVGEVMDK
jgi:mannose-6-phosphate isomerase-like protein (cupin superfamily)